MDKSGEREFGSSIQGTLVLQLIVNIISNEVIFIYLM